MNIPEVYLQARVKCLTLPQLLLNYVNE